ncbi:MAG: BatD family protein [Polyangiales bacterium]
MRLSTATVCLSIVAAASAARAETRVTVQVDPPTPEVGQVFRVVYTLQVNGGGNIAATPLELGDLDVLSNPGPPQMPQMMVWGGGGMMMFNSSTEYAVRARRPGRYTIRGARAVDRQTGRTVAQSGPVTFTVARAGSAPQVQPGMPNPMPFPAGPPGFFPPGMNDDPEPEEPQTYQGVDVPPQGRLTGAVADRSGFLRVAVDNPEPWVGQQVIWRAWIYVPSYEAGCESVREPAFDGFWSEVLFQPQQACAPRWIPQRVGSVTMTAGMTRRVALFPTRAGALTVGPLTMRIEYVEGDAFFGRRRLYEVTSPSLTLTAREPPTEGRPPTWVPGTIGPVTLQASLDRDNAPVGETVTLTVRAQGNGYLGSVGLPPLPAVEGVRVLPGNSRSQNDTSGEDVVGHLTNEYRVVADAPGPHPLGTLRVPWFDPSTQRYQVAEVVLPTLTSTGEAARPDADANREDPTTTLNPLRPSPPLSHHRAWFTTGPRVWGAVLFPPVALALYGVGRWVALAWTERRRARAEGERNDPDALLRQAKAALDKGDTTTALSLAGRALDRAERAAGGALDDVTKARLRAARQRCDDARFGGAGDAAAVLDEARSAVTAAEASA